MLPARGGCQHPTGRPCALDSSRRLSGSRRLGAAVALQVEHHRDISAPRLARVMRDHRRIPRERDAGVRIFVAGLQPAGKSKSLRAQPDGRMSSPTDPTSSPKNTWAVFGYWKPQTWARR